MKKQFNVYSDSQTWEVIEEINTLLPKGISIVDVTNENNDFLTYEIQVIPTHVTMEDVDEVVDVMRTQKSSKTFFDLLASKEAKEF